MQHKKTGDPPKTLIKHNCHTLSPDDLIIGNLYIIKNYCFIFMITDGDIKNQNTQKLTTSKELGINYDKTPVLLIKYLDTTNECCFLYNNIMFLANLEHVAKCQQMYE
jgi:hypothetical protein